MRGRCEQVVSRRGDALPKYVNREAKVVALFMAGSDGERVELLSLIHRHRLCRSEDTK